MTEIRIKHRQAHKRAMIRTEDGLTFNIFNRLSYLSTQSFGKIFNETFCLEIDFNALNGINFWPKWNAKNIKEIKNSTFIEPDIFLRFESCDIIIEAKRYDVNQQSEFQWRDQKIAYNHLFSKDKKNLIFIALGGMSFNTSEHSNSVIQSYWFQLAQTCQNNLRQKSLKHYEQRIVSDVLETLYFYNHKPLNFLESLKPIKFSTNSFKF